MTGDSMQLRPKHVKKKLEKDRLKAFPKEPGDSIRNGKAEIERNLRKKDA